MFSSCRTAQKHDNKYEYQSSEKTKKCTVSHSETEGVTLTLGAADRLSAEETLREPLANGRERRRHTTRRIAFRRPTNRTSTLESGTKSAETFESQDWTWGREAARGSRVGS